MSELKELTHEELENIDGGILDVLSFGLAALWCCYELGSACAAYDKRHKL